MRQQIFEKALQHVLAIIKAGDEELAPIRTLDRSYPSLAAASRAATLTKIERTVQEALKRP